MQQQTCCRGRIDAGPPDLSSRPAAGSDDDDHGRGHGRPGHRRHDRDFQRRQRGSVRPLPYADPGRLVRIYTDAPPFRFRFSVADYLA